MWCDVRVPGATWAVILVLLTSGLAVTGPAVADHGPLPTGGPTAQAAQAFQDDTQASLWTAEGTAGHAQGQSVDAVQVILDGLEDQQIRIPLGHVDSILARGFDDAEEVWLRTIGSLIALHAASGGQLEEAEVFRELLVTAVLNRAGVSMQEPIGSLIGPPSRCVDDLQKAVDQAAPGEEIRVCAGVHPGPIHVRQHFLNIIAEQGPAATIIDAGGSDGLVINATGVTIGGFRVQGADGNGTAGIRVGGNETHQGVTGPTGTVLVGNELRRNTHGVIVHNAPGTVVVANTFWASAPGPDDEGGIGLFVTGDGQAFDDPAHEGSGVWVMMNNFQNNAHHAVKSALAGAADAAPPTFAVFNHYNTPFGPNVQLGDACFGPTAPQGDPQCRDGIGPGVVPVGHHVQPW